MKLKTAAATTGRKKVACRVKGIPHQAASQRKTLVPIPPSRMAKPRINLEAMATVTELEDMMKSPAKAN